MLSQEVEETKLLSKHNLLKCGYFSAPEPSPVVIDSNELMEKKLRDLRAKTQNYAAQFTETQCPNDLEASDVARLLSDTEDEVSQEGFKDGIPGEFLPSAKQEAERILEEARQEAEAILEHAKEEAKEIRQSALEKGMAEGKKAGYEDGTRAAMIEMQESRSQLENERRQLQEEYNVKTKELEPFLAKALADIYEHIIHVSLQEKSDIVLHLLEDTIHKVEGCKNFIVHVSKETYEQVKARKADLLAAAATGDVTVEVIEDFALSEAECLVETENGIYDCSLDVQLHAIKEQIGILSYQAFES